MYWGYGGGDGPALWAELSPDFVECGSGRAQSPVALGVSQPVETSRALARHFGPGTLEIDERTHVLDLMDNGHTIQITADGHSSITLDGIRFELVQVHFHAPSEHRIDGRSFPLETHLVHRSGDGELAVVGVLAVAGDANPVYETVVAGLPRAVGDDRHLEDVDTAEDELLPDSDRYHRYDGSLTTPPCSEGVRWVVIADPVELSREQLDAFAAVLHDNNRPLQPLNGRRIGLITD